jgi:hypothetical protein
MIVRRTLMGKGQCQDGAPQIAPDCTRGCHARLRFLEDRRICAYARVCSSDEEQVLAARTPREATRGSGVDMNVGGTIP